MAGSQPLVCPNCASTHPLEARFCPTCRMPLVYAGARVLEAPITEAHERARKIKPQLAEGDLVRVAGGRNQPEAEFIQGLLLEEGVPSMLRRARGFDVPDFLAAGPRDVLVPQSGATTAREVLLDAEMLGGADSPVESTSPARLLAGLLIVFVAVAIVAWLGTKLIT
jgi:hypothetical protein